MKRILVIDDDSMIRMVLRSELEEEGYEVHELESGEGATAMIEKIGIDLITLDLYMEGKEGLNTLMDIRKSFKEQPIIVISSNDDFFEIALDMGANRTVKKPIDMDNLLEMVKELLA